MKIERMLASFVGGPSAVYVDKEEHLASYNMERLSGMEVRVTMNRAEFEAFREWKKQYEPKKAVVVEEKPKVFGEFEEYAY
jgi:putative cell wall-binding protein